MCVCVCVCVCVYVCVHVYVCVFVCEGRRYSVWISANAVTGTKHTFTASQRPHPHAMYMQHYNTNFAHSKPYTSTIIHYHAKLHHTHHLSKRLCTPQSETVHKLSSVTRCKSVHYYLRATPRIFMHAYTSSLICYLARLTLRVFLGHGQDYSC